ncbi:MAG TPA: hypothetical protein VI423_08120 [Paenisporosarcina sp.]|nr:hypothetical protein [Paenisporosarcina sp.]
MANLFDDVFAKPEVSGVDLRIVVFKSDQKWIARCLDYEFTAESELSSVALDNLSKAILESIKVDIEKGIEPLSLAEKPPASFLEWVKNDGLKEVVCFYLTLVAFFGEKSDDKNDTGYKVWN